MPPIGVPKATLIPAAAEADKIYLMNNTRLDLFNK